MPRIAVVKSYLYQDLWVSPITSDPYTLFKTTLMRCPPIGLTEKTETDYIIVKFTDEYPCNAYKNNVPEDPVSFIQRTTSKISSLPFLDDKHNSSQTLDSVSVHPEEIDWSIYDIVLTINACIPLSIVQQYPRTMWCYYISENDSIYIEQKFTGYTYILNQDVTIPYSPQAIGFPYSMISSKTYSSLYNHFFNCLPPSTKCGIFMEINNTSERPVTVAPPEICDIQQATGQPIRFHNQDILENCKTLCESKYYIKLLGRVIRGNSLLEAISAGCIILADKNLLLYKDLCHPFCHIHNTNYAIDKILQIEEDEELYETILSWQKEQLDRLYFNAPYNRLIEAYHQHIATSTVGTA
jgi:hypothetical protein